MKSKERVLPMKKWMVLFLLFILSLSFPLCANEPIRVFVNGRVLPLDVPPVIENGRTLLPLRAVAEALGCAIEYDEEDGHGSVRVQKEDHRLSLAIGNDSMDVDGDVIFLDTAARIENGRTLLPLRAMAEALSFSVSWEKDSRSISIIRPHDAHQTRTAAESTRMKAADGQPLIEAYAAYPVFDEDSDAAFLNERFHTAAKDIVKTAGDMFSDANELYLSGSAAFPWSFDCSYFIPFDRNGLLSIATQNYQYAGGAHGSFIVEGYTFDLSDGRELTLDDILSGTHEENLAFLKAAFFEYLTEDYQPYADEFRHEAEAEMEHVSFYLTNDGLSLFFQQYQVGPYALGMPTAHIPYLGHQERFRVDLSGVYKTPPKFSLPGNPTTGYEWEAMDVPSCVSVSQNYVPDENKDFRVGVGGTYYFTITPVHAGNGTLRVVYHRPWEEGVLSSVEYDFRVDADGQITLLNCRTER